MPVKMGEAGTKLFSERMSITNGGLRKVFENEIGCLWTGRRTIRETNDRGNSQRIRGSQGCQSMRLRFKVLGCSGGRSKSSGGTPST